MERTGATIQTPWTEASGKRPEINSGTAPQRHFFRRSAPDNRSGRNRRQNRPNRQPRPRSRPAAAPPEILSPNSDFLSPNSVFFIPEFRFHLRHDFKKYARNGEIFLSPNSPPILINNMQKQAKTGKTGNPAGNSVLSCKTLKIKVQKNGGGGWIRTIEVSDSRFTDCYITLKFLFFIPEISLNFDFDVICYQ